MVPVTLVVAGRLEALVSQGYCGWYLGYKPGTNRGVLDQRLLPLPKIVGCKLIKLSTKEPENIPAILGILVPRDDDDVPCLISGDSGSEATLYGPFTIFALMRDRQHIEG